MWVPGAQRLPTVAAFPFPRRPLDCKQVRTHFPRESCTSGLAPITTPSPQRSQSAGPVPGKSNKVAIHGLLTPLPGARTHLCFPATTHPMPPAPQDTGPPWHSLVQDKVEIKGASAAGLLLGAQQPPGTAERQQPQPRDQPAPRTAGRRQPRHHPAGGPAPPSAPGPLGGAPRGAAAVVGVPQDRGAEGRRAARAPAPGAAEPAP